MQKYFDIEPSFYEKLETATKKELREYASSLPTLPWFLASIKIDRDTFFAWLQEANDESYTEKDKKDKIELLKTYKKCMEISEHIWITNGLKWLYNASFATFVGKNIFSWKDKSELIEKEKLAILEKDKEAEEKIKSRIEKMDKSEIDRVILEILN